VRGVAALIAALAVWVGLGGRIPAVRIRSVWLPSRRDAGLSLAWGVGAAAAAFLLLQVVVAAIVVGALTGGAGLIGRRLLDERHSHRVAESWPDFLAMTRSRLAAGRPLPEATVEAAFHGGDVLVPFAQRLELSLGQGNSFRAALETERTLLSDPVADRVLTSLAFAAQAGGSRVADILGLLGQSVSDELRLRRAHHAALTQQRLTAAVALGAPWGLLVLTIATNPQAADIYATDAGARIVLLGLALTLSGFLLALRSARLSRQRRIFG